MDDNIIEHDVVEGAEKRLIASLPKDGVRSLFHLLAGKPDSIQKPYGREVIVSVDSIIDLHDRVIEKLKNHHIEGLVASVDVSYEDNTTAQFGSWAEFTSHRWTGPEYTKEVIVRWDFLVSMPDYEIAQRHALTVTITGDIKPLHFLRTVLTNDLEDMDNIELTLTPVIARVDFINHILSKELISIVDEWNRALPQPKSKTSLYKFLKRNDQKIKSLMRNSLPLLSFIVAFISLNWIYPGDVLGNSATVGEIKSIASWLLIASASLLFITRLSDWMSDVTYQEINRYGKYSIFNLTNGDKNIQVKLEAKNKRSSLKIFSSSIISLILNVVAGIIVVRYFSG
jgi:hypothetical protein